MRSTTLEVEPRAAEPNHRDTSQDHGFLSSADHPLTAPGDLEDVVERPHDDQEPCPPSEVTRDSEFSRELGRGLSLHRRYEHIPFDSRCVYCIKIRSTLPHGRVDKSKQSLVAHLLTIIRC